MKPISANRESETRTRRAAIRKNSCFTLLEMITVMVIIFILAGLLLAALTGARRAAKEGAAKMKVQQIATACRAYYNEYGVWPSYPTGAATVSSPIWASIMAGTDTNNNPRKILFMEFKSQETNSTGILDPWGVAYKFAFDTNFDNVIDIGPVGLGIPNTGCSCGQTYNTGMQFAIWSCGDPKKCKVICNWQQ